MRGRSLVIAGAIGLAVFTAALWYFQTYAFYEELPQQPLVVSRTAYPVETWRGIDAETSPLKRRVCLRVSAETARRIDGEQAQATGAEPLVAPGWFDCFDAKALALDVNAGAAKVYRTGASHFDGVDEMLALYADGRGFIWRQLKPEFLSQ